MHPAVPSADASIPCACRYDFQSGWDWIAARTAARSVVFKVIIWCPFYWRCPKTVLRCRHHDTNREGIATKIVNYY